MREIKFRAWDLKDKWMVLPSRNDNWIDFNRNTYTTAEKTYDTPNTEIEETKNYVLMQFTGLKDKNGKEIYEGDIVIGTIDTDATGEIIFRLGAFTMFDRWLIHFDYLEVIGNVYENPNLL